MNTRIIDPESDESSQGRDSGHSPRPDQSSPVHKKTRAWSIVRRSTTTSHLLCHTTTRDHQSPASSALSATTTTTTHPPSTTTTPPRTNQPTTTSSSFFTGRSGECVQRSSQFSTTYYTPENKSQNKINYNARVTSVTASSALRSSLLSECVVGSSSVLLSLTLQD